MAAPSQQRQEMVELEKSSEAQGQVMAVYTLNMCSDMIQTVRSKSGCATDDEYSWHSLL